MRATLRRAGDRARPARAADRGVPRSGAAPRAPPRRPRVRRARSTSRRCSARASRRRSRSTTSSTRIVAECGLDARRRGRRCAATTSSSRAGCSTRPASRHRVGAITECSAARVLVSAPPGRGSEAAADVPRATFRARLSEQLVAALRPQREARATRSTRSSSVRPDD